MTYNYRPELLEAFYKLDQGGKIQAECACRLLSGPMAIRFHG